MKSKEFIEKLKLAANKKTLYVMGCFGAPMGYGTNRKRYSTNYDYNKQASRTKMIMEASNDTFGFDCVCLIKGILWGWNADVNKVYGGAVYASNDVPDIGAGKYGIISECADATDSNWDNIQPGEIVWIDGHVGAYVGDGKVIECTPAWDNKVQYSNLGNIAKYKTGHYRIWTKHAHLPWVDYSDQTQTNKYKVTLSGSVNVNEPAKNEISTFSLKYGFGYKEEKISDELKLGDTVKMQKNAPVYGTSKKFASWVYDKTLYVRSIDGNRIVVSTLKVGDITGSVDRKYLTKI